MFGKYKKKKIPRFSGHDILITNSLFYIQTESNTPVHTGGGLIKSHFWLEILLKLDHQTIQIKALVCDSVKPFDLKLPLRPIEIEFENNCCCIEVHNTSNSTVEFLYSQEIAYFYARSKGLVQTNNSKHFPIDQYLHDRMTPATLSPIPLAYEKPIHPTERPHITTCTELSVDNTNKPTPDDKYPLTLGEI